MAVHAIRLDERHRRGDAAEQRLVDGARGSRLRSGRRGRRRRHGLLGGIHGLRNSGGDRVTVAAAVPVPVPVDIEQPAEAGQRVQHGIIAFEQLTPLGRHAGGALEIVLQQLRDVAGVEPLQLGAHLHPVL